MTNPTTRSDLGPSGDTAPVAWAATRTMAYDVPPSAPYEAHSPTEPAAASTAPALNPPVWSGRKTAVAAALAIGISAMGAVGAAAALPVGSAQGGWVRAVLGSFQPGGFGGRGPGGFGRGQQSQPGVPGQGQAPTDPNASGT